MEEVEIPAHFLCPISLQLMRDPVMISTGITYDRESIEKWLFSIKSKTCPVTKQTLQDSDLTPNLTLHRLIRSWCNLNASIGIETIPTPNPPIDKTLIAKLIKDATKFPDTQVKCLKTLRSIALGGERSRSFLESTGAVEFLVSIIKSHDPTLPDPETSDGSEPVKATASEALSILYQIKVTESRLKSIISNHSEFIEHLIKVMRNGNYQSRTYAIMLLKDVFKVANPIQLTSVTPEFFAQIVGSLDDQISQQAFKAALKLMIEVCRCGRNRIKAVEGGVVFFLIEILLETSEKRASELALTVLDQLCRCAEGRAEFLTHGAGMAMVSKKIFRVSHVASDKAVRILSSICRYSATSRVVQEMLEVGAVSKLCLVLQIISNYKAKERVREILKLHSSVWRNSSCIPSHLLSSYPS